MLHAKVPTLDILVHLQPTAGTKGPGPKSESTHGLLLVVSDPSCGITGVDQQTGEESPGINRPIESLSQQHATRERNERNERRSNFVCVGQGDGQFLHAVVASGQ